jgi:hypothetical protein
VALLKKYPYSQGLVAPLLSCFHNYPGVAENLPSALMQV